MCYDLDERGKTYLQYVLSLGRTLAVLTLDRVDLDLGRLYAILPPGVPEASLYDFRRGGVVPGILPFELRPRRVLVATLQRILVEGAPAVCILENRRASSTDTWLETVSGKLAFFRSEVYLPVTSQEASAERMAGAIGYAETRPVFWGICSTSGGSERLWAPDRITLDLPTMKELAARAYCIVVGAYDGEGYVVWRAGDGSRERQPDAG